LLRRLRRWTACAPGQPLHDQTRAVHGARFWTRDQGLVLTREDVGRHTARNKLIGAMARAGVDPVGGAVIPSSRVSVEMVQKCAMAGAPMIVAASTADAVRLAPGAGVTVACRARGGARRGRRSAAPTVWD
jgi:FdhD protein